MISTAQTKFGQPVAKQKNINGGIQYQFKFNNGFGASIVKHDFSYGSDEGLWEAALIDLTTDNLVYLHDFECDVIGFLSDADVTTLLSKIAKYPQR